MQTRINTDEILSLLKNDLSPDTLDNIDFDFIDMIKEPLKTIFRTYFRYEVYGLENIPKGAAIIAGNHNAGITFLEPMMMAAEYYERNGYDDPLYFLAHDAMVAIPIVKNFLIKCGCVRASYENSYRILDSGRKLVVFPGGNHEAFRTFSNRFRIDMGGHKGFAKLAVTKNVPVVPMLSVGGHETFFVLYRGEALAKRLKTDKLLRSKAFPVSIALPWIVAVGPVFHLPLPAKSQIEILPPIYPSEVIKNSMPEEEKTARIYNELVTRLQKKMDEYQQKRKFPVIG
ncbi:MAG: acyltransferase family protein [Deltaproteobacteria bacterium]|nr:acyltransferase family protein [Deltaproteobacteria bacterium]